ncbi:MAG: anthranilate synthase component I family protein [Planctomycetota bacterium]
MSVPPRIFRPQIVPLSADLQPPQVFAALADCDGLAWLDSAGGKPADFDLIGFEPDPLPAGNHPWRVLQAALADWHVEGQVPGPFHGGFLGALAYDLGVHGEGLELPAEPWGWPLLIGGIYRRFVVWPKVGGAPVLVLPQEEDAAEWLRRLENAPEPGTFEVGALQRHTPPAEHMRRIEHARKAIGRGEYYQVNLAHRFTAPFAGRPEDLYQQLRRSNPAPYCGYLRWSGGACLSTSPELLLAFDGKRAWTRPIKGTAPRLADEAADRAQGQALLASKKDRAELAMIVDLERNDLGRVAEVGSVRVAKFPELESYARVHHLVATVEAQMGPGIGALDLLKALFPGGSITGAPKLASMEAIAALEGEGRGMFTGSLGMLDFRGHALFNILIRTVLWQPGAISLRVGGGITFDSDAADEEAETLHKARGMIDAWGGL